ncbi:sulfatase-like hydrolase/transferase [Tabrizicola sp.]|uniref:sulfatase-like hydrolase/transferase n=1 Tax=Tabrizicola sp. TaxID=2005166 RepID=UPI003F400DC2
MHLRLMLCAAMVFATPAAAQETPNILLIIADDFGLDASSCYDVRGNQATMPNIDALCAAGMVFENAYAAPTCSPTRATIMTGRYGFRTGVGTAIPRDGGVGLSADEVSLFDVLNETGYASAVIGKWHLAGSDAGMDHPADLGVTDYFGLYSGAIPDYYSWSGIENGKTVKVEGYATTVLTDRAVDWVAAQQSPWFLWLAYNAPHAPFHVPPADLHSADDLADDKASIDANPLPYYNAALEALDDEIGRLLASMPEDVRDNTVIIFIGDNGTPGQVTGDFYGDRGAKGGIFEGGTHVPFIVQGPGVAAGRSEALVNTADLHATIAALAGAATDTGDSYDIGPALTGGEGARAFAYVEHFLGGGQAEGRGEFGWAIRDKQYKLVAVDGQDQMLFDLAADPLEQTDLLAGEPSAEVQAKVTELQAAYDAVHK